MNPCRCGEAGGTSRTNTYRNNHMKKDKNHQGNGNAKIKHSVRIEFSHPTAKSVSVAGTFNEWRPGATEMVPVGQGRWLKELVLPPGRYEYRLVVDNEWMADPQATETAPNQFGGVNSVLNVLPPEDAPGESSPARPRDNGKKP